MRDHSASSLRLTCDCDAVTFSRSSADAPTRCAFCHGSLRTDGDSASDPEQHEESVSPQRGQAVAPVRRRVFVAEIVCVLCGREAGIAVAEHWPPTGPILFQPPDKQAATHLHAWWRLRCAVCGGNTAANEVATRTVRLEPAIDWREVRPPRGRPPKWLLEQRRAAATPSD